MCRHTTYVEDSTSTLGFPETRCEQDGPCSREQDMAGVHVIRAKQSPVGVQLLDGTSLLCRISWPFMGSSPMYEARIRSGAVMKMGMERYTHEHVDGVMEKT